MPDKSKKNHTPQKNEGNAFRISAFGFDKNDVTLYINDMRKRMLKMEAEYQERIDSLMANQETSEQTEIALQNEQNELTKLQSVIDEEKSRTEHLVNINNELQKKIEVLNQQIETDKALDNNFENRISLLNNEVLSLTNENQSLKIENQTLKAELEKHLDNISPQNQDLITKTETALHDYQKNISENMIAAKKIVETAAAKMYEELRTISSAYEQLFENTAAAADFEENSASKNENNDDFEQEFAIDNMVSSEENPDAQIETDENNGFAFTDFADSDDKSDEDDEPNKKIDEIHNVSDSITVNGNAGENNKIDNCENDSLFSLSEENFNDENDDEFELTKDLHSYSRSDKTSIDDILANNDENDDISIHEIPLESNGEDLGNDLYEILINSNNEKDFELIAEEENAAEINDDFILEPADINIDTAIKPDIRLEEKIKKYELENNEGISDLLI